MTMARPLRLEYPNALYHVTSRGDRREDIFSDDADRRQWLEIFASVCQRMNWLCYAYCLMDNHYHIVIETPQANLSLGMRQLNGVFTQKSNRRHGRGGHVFQGRYKAIVIDKDNYLLEICRYVALNPLRAGLVEKIGDWPWSSYLPTSGDAEAPPWLAPDAVLALFGPNQPLARSAYRSFVRQGINRQPLWNELRSQIYLGDHAFIHGAQKKIASGNDFSEIPSKQRIAPRLPLATYREQYPNPREAMARAFLGGHYTMKEIGTFFNVHYSTVSRWVQRFEAGHPGSEHAAARPDPIDLEP